MAPKLYTMGASPPARSTVLTVRAIGLEADIVVLDPFKGEHLTPEFVKINPDHKIPTLDDDGFILWDSHAINKYLVQKYGKDDSLYPNDLQKQAIVDQRLHFNGSVLQPQLGAIIKPMIQDGVKKIPKDKADLLIEAYNSLETALDGKNYVAGDNLTIADFSIVSSISTAVAIAPIASNRFPNISEWLGRMQELPYYREANQKGADLIAAFIKSKIN